MESVFESGASPTPPDAPTSPSRGFPVGGETPTGVGAWWFYMITQELVNLAKIGGSTVDYTKVDQCAKAIVELISGVPTKDHVWTAGQAGAILPVPYASTVTLDFKASNNFTINPSLQGAMVLANPQNVQAGQTGFIVLPQDAAGGRVCAYGSSFRFVTGTVPAVSTVANAIDVLLYLALASNAILAVLLKDIRAAS